jgi:DNA-binding NarL/FixJ family response regulator
MQPTREIFSDTVRLAFTEPELERAGNATVGTDMDQDEMTLRPIERTIVRMTDEGIPTAEIARRLGRRTRSVRQIRWLAGMRPLSQAQARTKRHDGPNPLERCVLRLLESGESYGMIGNRIQRSGAQVRRIETYALYKQTGEWSGASSATTNP